MIHDFESLSDNELLFAYKNVILHYETSVKDANGFYSGNKDFQSFIKNKNILIAEVLTKEIEIESDKEDLNASSFLFTNSKGNQIKSLFYHLRNSFAHGSFTKMKIGKTDYFCFEDINPSKQFTMRGKIQAEFFEEFIEKLKQAKK
jgi:hypothetical protein